MITFLPASSLPSVLKEHDLDVLGSVLSKMLRQRSSRKIHVGIRFVSLKEMQTLNKLYRGKNRPTDVLSFEPAATGFPKTVLHAQEDLGDLVICVAYAREEAKRRHLPIREELVRLLAHGVLHLSGYDHATEPDELRMFALQETCVEKTLSLL